jgi:pimeloyl-ACP methyl ester carboxylesterase
MNDSTGDGEVRTVSVHGHPVTFRQIGGDDRPADAPHAPDHEVIVLVHGLAGSLATWAPVLGELTERDEPDGSTNTGTPDRIVIALDLAGHGGSIHPNADVSIGGYADGIRDLLATLGYDHATLVGHSLGGGVAMQFAYQFPEWCDRLVLVSSGGLGRSVHLLLRAATLPGSEVVLPLLAHPALISTARRLLGITDLIGLTRSPEPLLYLEHLGALADHASRETFTRTVRGALDLGGQRLNGTDRLYLAADIPTLVVWGAEDPIIPVGHAHRAMELIEGAELEIFEGSGHFPHCHQPRRFVDLLLDFCARRPPAHLTPEQVRDRLHGSDDHTDHDDTNHHDTAHGDTAHSGPSSVAACC